MKLKNPVYMDAHATTPVDPRVLAAMLPFFTERFGNAASRDHSFGWDAANACEEARELVAQALGAESKEIVWTSGATESDNLALLGAADSAPEGRDGLVVSAIEHKAILDTAQHLAGRGIRVSFVRVDSEGIVDVDELARLVDARTFLVSIMTANNEVGTIQPLDAIVRIVRERSSALVHTDAVQAIGRIPVDARAADVDLLSMSAHKVYGPKGVGALFVRRRRPTVRLAPILHGGGHERGMRSGTLNVPGIVGMGEAFKFASEERKSDAVRASRLRDRLYATLREELDGVALNGHATRRLPNNLNVSFARVEAEELLRAMPDVAVSTGAACSSASLEPSHVIAALGLGQERAQTSIRFGLTRFNDDADLDFVAGRVIEEVRALRSLHAAPAQAPRSTRR